LHPPRQARAAWQRVAKDVWDRITKEGRPYSLRYGLEAVSRRDASSELELAEPIVQLLVEECT